MPNVDVKFDSYIRKPFEVEAVEVTRNNIKELAEMIGTIQYEADGTPYIEVDAEKVPNLRQVWPGYWVTKVGAKNIRCYTRKIFFSQFVENSDEIDAWVKFLNGKPPKTMRPPSTSVDLNCAVTGTVDFGKGLVEVRCTETELHDEHLCEVYLENGVGTVT